MKKLYIDTLGCQMNKSDTERIIGMLTHFGYEQTSDEQNADLYIVNTCAIRQLSVDKAYSRLGNWGKIKRIKKKEENKNIKIAICGCVSNLEKESLLKKFPYLDLVFGTRNIFELPKLLEKIEENRICALDDMPISENDYNIIRDKSVNAWLPIMEGCNNFCSYCVVPYTRGRERSRSIEAIVKEAKNIIAQGFREITLLGQNVDSYGKNLENTPSFAQLLKTLDELDGDFRIRFTSSYPTDITDEVIEVIKNSKHICECFHIPMQSGNDRVLKAMNRRYNVEQYRQIVKKIRENIKNVTITSDFIAGFPGETFEEFEDTIKAIDELQLDYSNTAAYSPRPITKAGKMVDLFLSDEEKKKRLAILNDKVKEASLKSNEKYIGSILEILIDGVKDGVYQGRTRNNKVVHIEDNKEYGIGQFVNIKIDRVTTWCMFGKSV
ncbi:MAG: tRNA (N6-isopentenyl adenosine(37)-C2)-methylthiotransferase MiaB [Candidatus Gastranaerophilales bacterium]|nr:tRNA (N6-isopentenyl adenosine(37)-C2)-methylthiotransferase MiaB [Candidatus Gastranaerophilales bacterium]